MPIDKPNYLDFESALPIIENLLKKHRHKWNIKAIAGWMDWEDVSQIIRIHLFKKWNQYDSKQKLEPWVNAIINNQMINLSRNVYYSNERPCLKCSANEGGDLCNIYEKQCSLCPLFKKWEKSKKSAHDIRLPLPIENHTSEVFEMPIEQVNLEKGIENFHDKMKEILKPIEYKIYELVYIQKLSDEEVGEKMGYKISEKGKTTGQNSIIRTKKIIFKKAQTIIKEIDFA